MRSLNTPGSASRNSYYNQSLKGTYKSTAMGPNYLPGGASGFGGGGAAAGGGGYYGGGGNASSNALAASRGAYGGGGGGSGGYGGNVPGFIQEYQNEFDKANRANESRYGDILGQYNSLYGRQMDSFSGGNAQNIADINQSYDSTGSANTQDLIDRGLTGSTISANIRSGNERDRGAAINRENFNYQNQRRAADAGLTTDKLNFMERRTDKAPDINQLIALSQAYGNSGGGGGGAPGAYGPGGGGASWGGMQTGFGAMMPGAGFGSFASPFAGNSMHAGIKATGQRQANNTKYAASQANIAKSMGANYYNAGYSNQGAGQHAYARGGVGDIGGYNPYGAYEDTKSKEARTVAAGGYGPIVNGNYSSGPGLGAQNPMYSMYRRSSF